MSAPTITDLFCGAGGSSLGAEAAGGTLVMAANHDQVIDDCGFRMLEPYEVAAAMAFPVGYIPRDIAKKDQVKLAGNAVTPPVMQWIVGRIIQALETH